MATLAQIKTDITRIVRDASFESQLTTRINEAVQRIAAGMRLPNDEISPPLPDLYSTDTVSTSTTLPYVSMPTTYQRGLFNVSDSNGFKIYPVQGGDYYNFKLFMAKAVKKDLSLPGTVLSCCVKGNNFYYQGIPAASETLTLQFYRLPVDMSATTDEPDGLPDHLARKLIKHFVCKEIFGESIEDGEDNQGRGTAYHEAEFYKAMVELADFIGVDDEPMYYGIGNTNVDARQNW